MEGPDQPMALKKGADIGMSENASAWHLKETLIPSRKSQLHRRQAGFHRGSPNSISSIDIQNLSDLFRTRSPNLHPQFLDLLHPQISISRQSGKLTLDALALPNKHEAPSPSSANTGTEPSSSSIDEDDQGKVVHHGFESGLAFEAFEDSEEFVDCEDSEEFEEFDVVHSQVTISHCPPHWYTSVKINYTEETNFFLGSKDEAENTELIF
ncbi:hypothetical protein Dimus_015407 [Dionaea muscipula]